MFLPHDEIANQAPFDICIVGSGPAGLTIARRFLNSNKRILILESGGGTNFDFTADLNKGIVKNGGKDGWLSYIRPVANGLEDTRYRAFGGTMNLWAGRIRPFDPSDFDKPLPVPGWPISYTELSKWYDRALKDFGINGTSAYYRRVKETNAAFYPIPTHIKSIAHKSWIKVISNFGADLYSEIDKSANVHCVLDATANRLNCVGNDKSKSVHSISFANSRLERFNVKARHFVLACGGLENARLLMLSQTQNGIDSARPAGKSNWVGKCFMDHLMVPVGRLIAPDNNNFNMNNAYHEADDGRSRHSIYLGPSETILSHGENNGVIGIEEDKPCSDFWSSLILRAEYEQQPNRDSGVSLSKTQIDAIGSPRINLEWRMTDTDKSSILKFTYQVARAFHSFGARIRLEDQFHPSTPHLQWSGYGSHHMGTTRMSRHASGGVVDRNLKVHDTENLFIAGSSVFPSGGASNPTLTIVALSHRLASYLTEQLK